MSSAWGDSWGNAWGDAWGSIDPVLPKRFENTGGSYMPPIDSKKDELLEANNLAIILLLN